MFASRGDVEGEVAAFVLLGALAYGLVDAARMLPYFPRIVELAATGHPWAVVLDALGSGAFAVMAGDWRRAREVLAPLVNDPNGDPTRGIAAFLCARALVNGGRLQEAGALVDRMPESHRSFVSDGVLGIQVQVAQGLGAADAVLMELRSVVESRVDRRPVIARVGLPGLIWRSDWSRRDLDGARRHLAELARLGPATDASRDDELLAGATVAVAAGDEPAAAQLLAQIPDRGAFFPPLNGLVLCYVLRPELRPRYRRARAGGHSRGSARLRRRLRRRAPHG